MKLNEKWIGRLDGQHLVFDPTIQVNGSRFILLWNQKSGELEIYQPETLRVHIAQEKLASVAMSVDAAYESWKSRSATEIANGRREAGEALRDIRSSGGDQSQRREATVHPMTPDEFFARYRVPCFYHFTDARNLESIQRQGGLLSMQSMRDRKIDPPAPGGDVNSQLADNRKGMDQYVHLCLFNQNPMEFRAREDGRIQESRFLEIDRDVLRLDGVRFASAMTNQSGIVPLTLAEAASEMDFAAVYEAMDWGDPAQLKRVLTARKYELLVPKHIPLRYIRNF